MDDTATSRPAVGSVLRRWRGIRHLSQLELSLRAEVSQRHLSWLETGRSRPSRDLLLHLAEVLDVPLGDRNTLLHAAGYAAPFTSLAWDHPATAPVRDAIELLLARHEPNPAVLLDRRWSLVDANDAAVRLIATFGGPGAMAAAEGNAMRLLVHPDGLRPAIVNFPEVGAHLATRITREAASYPEDTELATLADELVDLIGPVPPHDPDQPLPVVVASDLRRGDDELRLLSMLATVGAALDVTVSELVVELFFPADPASAATLETMAAP